MIVARCLGLRRLRLPFVGMIAAGSPIYHEPFAGSVTVKLPRGSRAQDYFVVRVAGESLTGVNIHPGDYVVCRRAHEARNGELAAVLLNDGVTLKHVFKTGGWVTLVPGNEAYSPMRVRAEGIIVQGVVVSVERNP